MSDTWGVLKILQPEGVAPAPDFRKRVEWVMLLRLIVTTGLLAATIFFQLQEAGSLHADLVVPLYLLIGATFVLSLLYAVSLPVIPDLWSFSFFQVIVDVIYYSFLVYFTGGASSAFSLIYIFPIIASSILHYRRAAMLIAALSALLFGLLSALEFHQVIPMSDWPWVISWAKRSPGYILWILVIHFSLFFVIALMASTLAEQLQRTSVRLNRRELDYRKLSELHSSIVRSIPDGIITTDEHDRVTFVNKAGAKLLGTSLSELVSVPITDLFPIIDDDVAKSSSRRETYLTTMELGGESRYIELTVSDLRGEDGVPRGRLVVFQDVSHIKKMEERVRVSEQQAAFVRIAAGMAHAVRNPLAALRGASELLDRSPSDHDTDRRLLGIVMKETDRINNLLGDFLTTVNTRRPPRERVLFNELVEETVERFLQHPAVRGRIRVETLISRGVEVEGSPARLRKAVRHLLDNAGDVSPDGGLVRVRLESEPDNRTACLHVQDSGPGIDPEMKDRIFEPFTSSKTDGSGLGLALVLSVVEAHKGTIEAESAPDRGTVFVVRLPLASTATGLAERTVQEGGRENG